MAPMKHTRPRISAVLLKSLPTRAKGFSLPPEVTETTIEQGDDDAHKAFADDEARREEDAAVAAGFYVFFFMARAAESRSGLEVLMHEVADNRADDQGVSKVGGR